jgi:excisionase family DNA binding protein
LTYITTDEASKRLYTTPYTVRKYIRQGKLMAAKIGKQFLIQEDELIKFLESMVYKPGQEV